MAASARKRGGDHHLKANAPDIFQDNFFRPQKFRESCIDEALQAKKMFFTPRKKFLRPNVINTKRQSRMKREVILAIIETPVGCLEIEGATNWTQAMKFGEAQWGETPQALNAVDVILATGELIFVRMPAIMFIAIEHQAVSGLPAIG